MQKLLTTGLMAAGMSIATNSAFAADKEGVYVTVGATLISTEVDLSEIEAADQDFDFGTEDIDIVLINGRVGYRLNDYFAVEGEAGFGVGGDDFDRVVPVDVLGTSVDVAADISGDVNSYFIGFGRAIYPVTDQFDVFGRLGYGTASVDVDVVASIAGFTASGSTDQDVSSIAYGFGAQYDFTEKDGFRADYTRLDETDIISLAYSRRF